jgi:flagellar motor switch protein FliM
MLRDIVDLREGDVIPIEMPEFNVLTATGIPMFRAQLGRSKDKLAFKILGKFDRKSSVFKMPKEEEK